jgi:hypothetical protein
LILTVGWSEAFALAAPQEARFPYRGGWQRKPKDEAERISGKPIHQHRHGDLSLPSPRERSNGLRRIGPNEEWQ